MNITQIVASELSGFCDVATGECIVAEPETPPDAKTDTTSNNRDAPTIVSRRTFTPFHRTDGARATERGRSGFPLAGAVLI